MLTRYMLTRYTLTAHNPSLLRQTEPAVVDGEGRNVGYFRLGDMGD